MKDSLALGPIARSEANTNAKRHNRISAYPTDANAYIERRAPSPHGATVRISPGQRSRLKKSARKASILPSGRSFTVKGGQSLA